MGPQRSKVVSCFGAKKWALPLNSVGVKRYSD